MRGVAADAQVIQQLSSSPWSEPRSNRNMAHRIRRTGIPFAPTVRTVPMGSFFNALRTE